MTSTHSIRAVVMAALACIPLVSPAAAADEAARAATEQRLVATLRADGPEADKAMACKLLAIHGSAAAVADLAPLLADERLASWARIALEAIPGPEADAALRRAAETLAGRLQVGPINSLGVRRDAAAVPLLARLLAAGDGEVAAAAAAALGRIGTPEAAGPLAAALAKGPANDAVAEGCIVCAERLEAAGDAAAAATLYDLVRQDAAVSEQRRAEATRGLVVARGVAGLPLLVEALRSPSRRLANISLFTARELGRGDRADAALAEAVDMTLVEELGAGAAGGAAGERAVLVADVLAERNTGTSRPAVRAALLAAAERGPKPLRLAAIDALGRIGDSTAFAPLVRVAADPDPGFAVAVRSALARLPDATVDGAVRERLAGAGPAELPLLLGIVADRRIDAAAAVVPLVDHSDAKVRLAALEALGEVADLGRLDVLTQRVLRPRDAAEAETAGRALAAACVRMPDRDACAAKLAPAFDSASGPTKVALLEALGSVGGARALEAVAGAARGTDAALQDAATRLLGTWMTADAAPVLLELAGGEGKFRTRALRGYLRIARQFVLPREERAAMCRRAVPLARESVDRKAILTILIRYPSREGLAVVEEIGRLSGFEADAAAATANISAKLAAEGGGAAKAADAWLTVAGGDGPGKGKRVVLVSGDEEYRSEEALTQLGKILAKHHGFDCTVLYAIDPATGEIHPETLDNIPGLEALRTADLMVIACRFRNLPDGQMKEIDDYLRSGRPVVGMRTATHAFVVPTDRAYAHYGNGYAGAKAEWTDGFGRAVLGEKWIKHHGHHGQESTRGVIAPAAKDHPIVRGIAAGDIWGPTDVYAVRLPLPGDSVPLVLGEVLEGMTPDSPPVSGADAAKNDPMMPVAWTKTYAVEGGPRGRVFMTTMGAATDLAAVGTRRMLVNACYWAVGLEDRIPAASCVDVVGGYDPTPFGFKGAKRGVKPADLR